MKEPAHSDKISYLSKINTMGVRSSHIAGFDLQDYPVSKNTILKQMGDGVAQTFKAFQITRAILPGMSLGVADTYLRKTYAALNKNKQPLRIEQEVLADNFIRLLICDAVSIVAARAIHVNPAQLSIISAITKYFIPQCVLSGMYALSAVMRPAHLCREGRFAILQKFRRDYPVVSLGHAGEMVCLQVLLNQMRQLTTRFKRTPDCMTHIEMICCLQAELPAIDLSQLKMSNSGYLDILNSVFELQAYPQLANSYEPSVMENIARQVQAKLFEIQTQVSQLSIQVKDFSKATQKLLEGYVRSYALMCGVFVIAMNPSPISAYVSNNELIIGLTEWLIGNSRVHRSRLSMAAFKALAHCCENKLAFSFLTVNY